MENTTNNLPERNQEGKTYAILCYLTIIGWIIAFLLHSGDKTKLAAFHLRQSLGLMVLILAIYLINYPLVSIPFFGGIASLILNAALVVLWVIGLLYAIKAEEKPLPVIGEYFQKWFAQLN